MSSVLAIISKAVFEKMVPKGVKVSDLVATDVYQIRRAREGARTATAWRRRRGEREAEAEERGKGHRGVSATNWWNTKADVVLEALTEHARAIAASETGSSGGLGPKR